MRRALLLPLLLIGQAMSGQGIAYLWQGFEHHWGYNHRLNRLGDALLVENGDKWTWQHTAASGSGADMGQFHSYRARIDKQDMAWTSGTIRLALKGGEMEELEANKRVAVPLPADWKGKPAAFLNGFDFQTAAQTDADKLVRLAFGIDTAWVGGDSLYLSLFARATLSCSSPECARGDAEAHGLLDLQWLALDMPSEQVQWEGDYEFHRNGPVHPGLVLQLEAAEAPGQKVVYGFRSMSFALEAEDHLASVVAKIEADEGQGALEMQLGQRQANMRKAYRWYYHGFPKLPAWIAVRKTNGHAHLAAEILQVQFEEGEVSCESETAERFWDSTYRKPRPASDSLALFQKKISEK